MIYIIGLENNKKFVYETQNTEIKQLELFTELYVLYHFCRINKPQIILYTDTNRSINNIFINTIILYGKNNVRGYIYIEPELPYYKNQILDDEINYFINKSFPISEKFMENYNNEFKVSKYEIKYKLDYSKKEYNFMKKTLNIRNLFLGLETFSIFSEKIKEKCDEILLSLDTKSNKLSLDNSKYITSLVNLYIGILSCDIDININQNININNLLNLNFDKEYIDIIINNKYNNLIIENIINKINGLETIENEKQNYEIILNLVKIFKYMIDYLWNVKQENDYCISTYDCNNNILESIEKKINYYDYLLISSSNNL